MNARPVCILCMDAFEIGYAAKITRTAFPAILCAWAERSRCRERNAAACEAWSRRRAGGELPADLQRRLHEAFGQSVNRLELEELKQLSKRTRAELRDAERSAYAAIHAATQSLDFPALFAAIAGNEFTPLPDLLPRIPIQLVQSE